MSFTYRVWFAAMLAAGSMLSCGRTWAAEVEGFPTLARSVPATTRLFLEFRGANPLGGVPGGSAAARLFGHLVTSTQPVASRPAQAWLGWQAFLADAAGLDNRVAAELLFAGPIALAADDWSGLGDAVLLARPPDAAGLEAALKERLDAASAGQRVRRYRLARDHELACDGGIAVVGLSTNPSGLYRRSTSQLEDSESISLGDISEFRERMDRLPAGAQLVIYAGSQGRLAAGGALAGTRWPETWPRLHSAALGVVVSPGGIIVEANGRLDLDEPTESTPYAPTHHLMRLPTSVVVSWTQPIDYVEAFRQIESANPEGALHRLQPDTTPEEIEERLLDHLVGDSIVMVASRTAQRSEGGPAPGEPLLPAIAISVGTDDPHGVELMLASLTSSFLASFSGDSRPADVELIRHIPLEPGGGRIVAIPAGRLLSWGNRCPFLHSLEISWTVADRWLVIGTDAEIVRAVVQARRGHEPTLPAELVPEVIRPKFTRGVMSEMLLVARPRAISEMIDSWIAYLSRHHPEMLEPQWWRQLQRRRDSRRVQLGILPTDRANEGGVEVGETLANYPAHGRLQIGDQIVAIDGEPLDRDRPLISLREKLAMRKRADGVTLGVIRDGKAEEIEITMETADWDTSDIQPVDLLRQAADLTRLFSSASYAVWRPSRDSINARLELRFASSRPGP